MVNPHPHIQNADTGGVLGYERVTVREMMVESSENQG